MGQSSSQEQEPGQTGEFSRPEAIVVAWHEFSSPSVFSNIRSAPMEHTKRERLRRQVLFLLLLKTNASCLPQHCCLPLQLFLQTPACHEDPCCHDDKSACTQFDDKACFEPKHLQKTPTWPKECCKKNCKTKFGVNHKVKLSNPVCCCANAKNTLHKCVHACCKPCFQAVESTEPSPRKNKGRSRRRIDQQLWIG